MKPVIEVSDISKSYVIRHQDKASYNTLKDDFANAIKKPFGYGIKNESEIFWALKDISFNVNQGEALGIVGMNGSGKSTLLKILSRIVDPSTGTIKIHGKVASMLEVGTGFHPELTGRENIFLSGSMIGMSRKEITRKFDQIVEFSEVEQFIDTPVKFYSSGMYVRLAFAVAVHLEPEILIIDEVLSVGDAPFQKKSLNKMMSIAKDGRTILFVSHSMLAVKQLCDKAILLKNGHIKYAGETEFVTDKYLSASVPVEKATHFKDNPKKNAQFIGIEIRDFDNNKNDTFDQDQPWFLNLRYKVKKSCPRTIVAVEVLNKEGQPIYMTSDSDYHKHLPTQDIGIYEAKLKFQDIKLVPGVYTIRASIQSPGKIVYDIHEGMQLKIRQNPKDIRLMYFKGKYMGFLSNKSAWDISVKK